MLVLSRQRNESIVIGDNIVITVVDIRGDKVRLGINAPNTVPVHRQEIFDAIQKERGVVAAGKPAGPPSASPTSPAPGNIAPVTPPTANAAPSQPTNDNGLHSKS